MSLITDLNVVYFDQPTYASACVCLIMNDKKCLKKYVFIMRKRGLKEKRVTFMLRSDNQKLVAPGDF